MLRQSIGTPDALLDRQFRFALPVVAALNTDKEESGSYWEPRPARSNS